MKKMIKSIMLLFFMGLIVFVGIKGVKYLRDNIPNKTRIDLSSIYKVDGDLGSIIFENVIFEENAFLVEGKIYLPMEFASAYISDKVFFDYNELVLSFTTPTQLLRSAIDSKEFTVNGEKYEENQKITVVNDKEKVFISIDFLEKYCNYEHSFYTEPNRVLIRELNKSDEFVTVLDETQIRILPDVKSEIMLDVSVGQEVYYLGEEVSEGWTFIMTMDGYQGYIKTKFISEKVAKDRPKNIYESNYTSVTFDGAVSMVWHQVTNTTANNNINQLISGTKGVNVVSPTWFTLSNAEGDIKSIASKEYVNTIHQKGMQVWGLVTNQFDRELTKELLSYSSRRDAFVKNIIDLALEYSLDGINIDFESFNSSEGEAFTELIRELSIQCRKHELILSVDIYVPSAWNLFIDRTAIAEVADYIIVMGYDEHWGGGPESGSVSSIGFFEKGLNDTLELAPANKIIMGLPFYTRLWEEVNGAIVSSSAYGMDRAKTILEEQGIAPVWDAVTGQFYAEYAINESLFKVWLEDESSIKERMEVIGNGDIAGVAAWKLGLESTTVWNVIESYNMK